MGHNNEVWACHVLYCSWNSFNFHYNIILNLYIWLINLLKLSLENIYLKVVERTGNIKSVKYILSWVISQVFGALDPHPPPRWTLYNPNKLFSHRNGKIIFAHDKELSVGFHVAGTMKTFLAALNKYYE